MERSPNACSGNKALKYAIFDTAIANNFFTNNIDFCSVMVSFGNIPVNYNKIKMEVMKLISNYIKSYGTFPGVHIGLTINFFHLSKPVICIICHKTY